MQQIAQSLFTALVQKKDLMYTDEDWELIMQIRVIVELGQPLSKGFMNKEEIKEQ